MPNLIAQIIADRLRSYGPLSPEEAERRRHVQIDRLGLPPVTLPWQPSRPRPRPIRDHSTVTDAHGDTYTLLDDGSKEFLYNNAHDMQQAWQLFGQFPSGLISSTVANTAPDDQGARSEVEQEMRARGMNDIQIARARNDPEYQMLTMMAQGYRPAIVDLPTSIFGAISSAVRPGSVAPDSFVGRSMERTARGMDRTNSFLGITDPQNALEAGVNVLGSMVVPTPVKAAIPVTAASRLGRAGQTAANVALETAIPLRNTSLLPATIAGSVFGVGVPELGEALGWGNNPNYHSISEIVSGTEQVDRPSHVSAPNATGGGGDVFDQAANEALQSNGDPFAPAEREAQIGATMNDHLDDAEQDHSWRNAAIALGTVFAGAAGYRMFRNHLRASASRLAHEAIPEAPELMGTQYRGSRPAENVNIGAGVTTNNPIITAPTSAVRRGVRAAFRQDEPIRSALLDLVGPNAAAATGHDLDLLTNTALGARFQGYISTGRTSSGFNGTALGPYIKAFGEELDPQSQRHVLDAWLAGRALDDLHTTGVQTAFPNTSSAQLQGLIDSVRNDPKLAKYLDKFIQSGRDLLRFYQHGGVIDAAKAAELAAARPRYAPFNRAVVYDTDIEQYLEAPFTANRSSAMRSASDVEGGSVAEGATANPLQALIGQWADAIRFVEQNKVRANALRRLDGMGTNPDTGQPWVKIIRRPEAHAPENVHTVWVNGKKRYYLVTDPQLNHALHFSPRATIKTLEAIRGAEQGLVTGPLGTLDNLFSVTKAAAYDASLGSLLRGRGNTNTGFLNELLYRITGGRLHLGALDPTVPFAGFTGAPRMLWGQMLEGISNRLTAELFKDHSAILGAMRAVGVDPAALNGIVQRAYQASTKANLDQLGVTSHTMFASPDPTKMLTNMHEIAPRFSTDEADRIYHAVLDGNTSYFQKVLANGRNQYAHLRANAIVRLYHNVLEAFQNGAKAQGYGTTKAMRRHRGHQLQAEQAAALRRASIDTSQHGGSNTINKVLGSWMYANTSMQGLYELGHAIKARPLATLRNYVGGVAALYALSYLYRMSDPAARDEYNSRTPEQQAMSVPLFGGAEYPVDPIMRGPTFAAFQILDEISGINRPEQNVDFAAAMDRLLGDSDEDREWRSELGQGMQAGALSAQPLDPMGFPLLNPALAALGIDVSQTRYNRESSDILPTARLSQGQQLSGLDQDSEQTDALLSEYNQNLLYSIAGALGRGMYQTANDYHRSFLSDNSVENAITRAAQGWQDRAERSSGIFRPLFGNYEHLDRVVDRNWDLYNQRRTGIETAMNLYNRDIRTRNITSQGYPLPQPGDLVLPNMQGTRAALVGFYAHVLNQYTDNARTRLANITQQANSLRNAYMGDRQENNRRINELTQQRQDIALWLLMSTRHYESIIGQRIGDPHFTFRNFNPRDYMQPLPQAPQLQQQLQGVSQ